MEKVKVTREVAEAIERLRNAEYSDYGIVRFVGERGRPGNKGDFEKLRQFFGVNFDRLMRVHVERLEQENKQLQEAFDTQARVHDKLNKDYVKVRDENKQLREALEFYADEKMHEPILISEAQHVDGNWVEPPFHEPPAIYFDKGETARKALEGKH